MDYVAYFKKHKYDYSLTHGMRGALTRHRDRMNTLAKYELVKEKYLYDSDENKQLLDEIFETYQIQANTMSKNTIKQIAKDLAPELRFINIDTIDDDNINNIINNNI